MLNILISGALGIGLAVAATVGGTAALSSSPEPPTEGSLVVYADQ